ncbi:hypothetical protein IVB18_29335 [Bradyrhizobium sp. 186]|uniref:hypothetical protein n=1 Tax=Bradyrhizobium sp. 186 TaxID=2782654 RepID=UPI0020018AA6|nr:hypothetical protein [Bradyrhizobium sp. 186]UPK32374.1 hypothetical protein IVB18_29335 [Bradyrhizobium sp. 186]
MKRAIAVVEPGRGLPVPAEPCALVDVLKTPLLNPSQKNLVSAAPRQACPLFNLALFYRETICERNFKL